MRNGAVEAGREQPATRQAFRAGPAPNERRNTRIRVSMNRLKTESQNEKHLN